MRGGHLLKPDCVFTTIGLPPFSSLSGGIPDVTMVYTKVLGTPYTVYIWGRQGVCVCKGSCMKAVVEIETQINRYLFLTEKSEYRRQIFGSIGGPLFAVPRFCILTSSGTSSWYFYRPQKVYTATGTRTGKA